MKNSVAMGSLSGIHEFNVGTCQGYNSFNSGYGDSSMLGSSISYGGSQFAEKPKQIQSTKSYLDNIEKKYNQDKKNFQNDHQDFPIGRKMVYEKKDGTYEEKMTIRNARDDVPRVFLKQDNNREDFRKSQRNKQGGQNANNKLYVSGRMQKETDHTNYGQNNNNNNNNNWYQQNSQQNYDLHDNNQFNINNDNFVQYGQSNIGQSPMNQSQQSMQRNNRSNNNYYN